jgi:hypothetical protein
MTTLSLSLISSTPRLQLVILALLDSEIHIQILNPRPLTQRET